MAIKKSITLSGMGSVSGIGFVAKTGETTIVTPPLYIKVESIAGKKEVINATVTYQDEVTGEYVNRKEYSFTPSMDGGNFIAQAYEHLKTLPEFEDAEDC